jgi:subtilase family serine protease
VFQFSFGMAPSAALIIACAALAAVILQATITWTPDAPSSSSANSKLAGWNMNAAVVAPNPSRLVLHEALADVPQGWARLSPATSSTPIHMRIALQSKDVSGLQKTLMDVSTPGSAKYGQHLNAAQVRARGPRVSAVN